jgi:hypothetical protein
LDPAAGIDRRRRPGIVREAVMEFSRKYRKPYYGRVLDGPFEGEWIEHDSPAFIGHFVQPLGPVPPINEQFANAAFEVDRAYYRWLSSYRAWVWMQPPGRPAESDAALRTRLAACSSVFSDSEARDAVSIASGHRLDRLAFLHGLERYLPPGTPRPDISVGRTHTGRIADALAFRGDQFGGHKP